MKKLIVGAVLGLAASIAGAQNSEWFLITESESGSQLYGKRGSFEIFTNEGVVYAGAQFRALSGGEPPQLLIGVVPLSACRANGGELIVMEDDDIDGSSYSWTLSGKKLSDAMAASICKAVTQLEQLKKGTGPSSKT